MTKTGEVQAAGGAAKFHCARLVGDGMVLQADRPARIRGFGTPGRRVSACLAGEGLQDRTADAAVGADGSFVVTLPAAPAGGPWRLTVTEEGGETLTFTGVLTGDVYFCSGQSNMDLGMDRVLDIYPEERLVQAPEIRTFRIAEHASYTGPEEDALTGEWISGGPETVERFGASAWFFARALQERTGRPVGLIHASLGGSRISSWLSREMLEGEDALLAAADACARDGWYEERLSYNAQKDARWHGALEEADRGVRGGWKDGWGEAEATGGAAAEDGCSLEPAAGEDDLRSDPADAGAEQGCLRVPCRLEDTALAGFTGSLWLQKSFTLTREEAAAGRAVWLGTISDSDAAYLNGEKIGETGYQYPPRKYAVPAGLLREGRNVLVLRIKVENGLGRLTAGVPEKVYALLDGEKRCLKDLRGPWQYRIGAQSGAIEPTDFVNWYPTGLWNGMAAPCIWYTIRGFLWYQGEADTHIEGDYAARMRRLIGGWRKAFGDEDLPFFFVQLPNFTGEQTEEETWPALRQKQFEVSHERGVGMICALDLGEDNDLHPLRKRPVGERLAALALHAMEAERECRRPADAENGADYTGPDVVSVRAGYTNPQTGKEDASVVVLTLSHAAGLHARVPAQCRQLVSGYALSPEVTGFSVQTPDFEIVDTAGNRHRAKVSLLSQCGDQARLLIRTAEGSGPAAKVLYCCHNTPHGALLYNEAGYPMPAFALGTEG